MIEAYPLQWPEGWKKTSYRTASRFKTTFGMARDTLMAEIRRLGGTGTILSTNVPTRKDGLPYSGYKEPTDPGAAVYFTLKGKQMAFACDKWRTVTENVQSLRMTIEAIRGIERWGASDMMERAFRGFTALPAPEGMAGDWRDMFGLNGVNKLTKDQLKVKRNELLRKYHPDFGTEPDTGMMARVNECFAQAERELS